ncbi:Dihydrolipoyllysine-residue succinyltransferase component of 2-oxoglutarate dehydrogenase complex [Candidatus Hartigia pinicola]|nr:Dihydrolipoyllysine-residue succinyltransferase component of 2-oxoglutarate dehydrogenase complex [Candidatus Hartigia pinicola]
MSDLEIIVPDLPESVANATVARWHKKPGDNVKHDEVLVEIETDKVILEVYAREQGVLETIIEDEGAIVISKQLLGRIYVYDSTSIPEVIQSVEVKTLEYYQAESLEEKNNNILTPDTCCSVSEDDLNSVDIREAVVNSRLTSQYTAKYLVENNRESSVQSDAELKSSTDHRSKKHIPMTRLRQCISERLLKAQNSMATLTTFNEVNMQPIKDFRKKYNEIFEKQHDVRLGFMSFYVKAAVEALKRYPEVNASIDGSDIVYHNYFDISIAISTSRGLVTPVLRDVDISNMGDIEKKIKEFTLKGQANQLTIEDLSGGNFTITNGGVFGSLMSTPIINPPQSAILGMHVIQDRPMAVNNKVEILPMMYLALSYDHRLIDGSDSIKFLIVIKELLEDPTRLLLKI